MDDLVRVTSASLIFTVIFQALTIVVLAGRNTSSSWAIKLRQLLVRLLKVRPAFLTIGLPVLALTEVFLIVSVARIWPNVTTLLFAFSITMAVFTTITSVFYSRLVVFGKWFWGLCLIAALSFGLGWIVQSNLTINNLTAVIAAIGLLIILPKLRPATVSAISIGVVVYDILGVWVTGLIVTLAFGLPITPPALIKVPVPALDGARFAVLGLGDFAFGIMIALSMIDRKQGLVRPSILFFLAIVLAYLLVLITKGPVPATVTIVPVMLVGMWWGIWRQKT